MSQSKTRQTIIDANEVSQSRRDLLRDAVRLLRERQFSWGEDISPMCIECGETRFHGCAPECAIYSILGRARTHGL